MALAISYHEGEDGMLYPDIKAAEQTETGTLGKFGIMAREYLEENYPQRYRSLVRFGNLYTKLKEVEDEANRMLEDLMEKYLEKHRPANPDSTMEAEEIIRHDLINQFH